MFHCKPVFRKLVVFCLSIALAAQGTLSPVIAAEQQATSGRIQDVELGARGMLATRVVDLQGKPVAGAEISVMFGDKVIATTVSDETGLAVVSGLRPGLHTIATPMGGTACRFWNEDTAPPSAVSIPAVVSDVSLVRGQFGAFNLPMLLYAGATIAAVIIAVDANNNADDANAANAALQARVEALEAASP